MHHLRKIARSLFDANDIGTFIGQLEGCFGGDIDPRPAGNIINHHWHRRHFRHHLEMLGQSPLVGLVVVRRHREDTADAVEVGLGNSVGESLCVVATHAKHDGFASSDTLHDEVLHSVPFSFGHGGRLAGRAQGDNIVYSAVEIIVNQCFQLAEIDGVLLSERGD